MKQPKKFILGIGAAALCVCAFAIGLPAGTNNGDELWADNVEALTGREVIVESSYSCSGVPSASTCESSCPICGMTVKGNGSMTGTHKCTLIEN